ncbi:unnamed protein product, partial [Phaeothamnion confervicola]
DKLFYDPTTGIIMTVESKLALTVSNMDRTKLEAATDDMLRNLAKKFADPRHFLTARIVRNFSAHSRNGVERVVMVLARKNRLQRRLSAWLKLASSTWPP